MNKINFKRKAVRTHRPITLSLRPSALIDAAVNEFLDKHTHREGSTIMNSDDIRKILGRRTELEA